MASEASNETENDAKTGINWVRALLIICGLFVMTSTTVCCGGPFALGSFMNAGDVDFTEIDDSWVVEDDYNGNVVGPAKPIKDALENQCKPMRNGIRVLFNHLWYNAITDGYDGRFSLSAGENSYDQFILYSWGRYVFVRDESAKNGYVNRVLSCELTYDDWSSLVESD